MSTEQPPTEQQQAPKRPAITQSFDLTPDAAAEMLVAAFGQNNIAVTAVYFDVRDNTLHGIKVVSEAPAISVRSTPEDTLTIEQKRRAYMQDLRENGYLLPVGNEGSEEK